MLWSLVSFQIVDRIHRQSSWASCRLCSHRRRRRDKTVSSALAVYIGHKTVTWLGLQSKNSMPVTNDGLLVERAYSQLAPEHLVNMLINVGWLVSWWVWCITSFVVTFSAWYHQAGPDYDEYYLFRSGGLQTFWGRGPDEPPRNLLRAGEVNFTWKI